MIEITGTVERITYFDPDSGFSVIKATIKGIKSIMPVITNAKAIHVGQDFTAKGDWILDPKHGKQFKAELAKFEEPSSLEGMAKFIGSGIIKGVGTTHATKIVNHFKEDTYRIMEEEPKRLLEVKGIGKKIMEKIQNSWKDQKAIIAINKFLMEVGVGGAKSVRIFKTYGFQAIDIIKENPYVLARDIQGIGFRTADAIALKMGISEESYIRVSAGIQFSLWEASNQGDTCISYPDLVRISSDILEISTDRIEECLHIIMDKHEVVVDMLESGELVISPYGLANAEEYVANRLIYLDSQMGPLPVLSPSEAVPLIENLEAKFGLEYAPAQKEALATALGSKVMVITGGPGCGKTTVVRGVIALFESFGLKIVCCAPTGKASGRMEEATEREAKTIHRQLGAQGPNKFLYNAQNPFSADVLIVDEFSMVDIMLMRKLLEAVPDTAIIVLVGDQDQLESVGPGRVFGDIIDSRRFPTVKLSQVFRQAAGSNIIQVATAVNKGKVPDISFEPDSDFLYAACEDLENVYEKLDQTLAYLNLTWNLQTDVQILTPMSKGAAGVLALNQHLQAKLNPNPTASVSRYGTTYSTGDKVMQIINDYDKEVYNGDVGFITAIDEEEDTLTVLFGSGQNTKEVHYNTAELDALVLAYATTIHKSQGSEYPVVVIILFKQHYPLLQKNTVYTGLTRGKKLVILLGQANALKIAVTHKDNNKKRRTRLKSLLQTPTVDMQIVQKPLLH